MVEILRGWDEINQGRGKSRVMNNELSSNVREYLDQNFIPERLVSKPSERCIISALLFRLPSFASK